MANLQLLRKRLKSVISTGQMAEAMKTVASVKYSKCSKLLKDFEDYSFACAALLEMTGTGAFERSCTEVKNRSCFVLLTTSRGFCGGFNNENLKFFRNELEKEKEKPLVIVLGEKGIRYCREAGMEFETASCSDIPSFEEAKALTERLLEIYKSGEADKVYIIAQRFINMMTQVPEKFPLLPPAENPANKAAEESTLFLPDRETAFEASALSSLTAGIYGIMLGHAAGAQGATVVAMRSACDNAEETSKKLDTMINRIRQAEVTNSVIETSSSARSEEI